MNRFNNRQLPLRQFLAVSIAATAAGLPHSALSQQAAIEEVVVTARKRAENLQEVPIAITAFTDKTLEQAGVERAEDFIALTPNVTIVDTANIGDTQVTIRGQVSTRDAESTFAYVVDGVLQTNPNSFNEELFDIQQIEVLKGPQGALYGRNATAGAILVTTKKPAEEFEGQVKVGAGTDNLYKLNGSISGPITDNLGYRVALSGRRDDGQYENSYTGEDDAVDYLEDTSLRGRLLWDVNDDFSLDFQLGYSEAEGGAINFNAVFAFPAIAGFPDGYSNVNAHDFKYVFNVPGENEQETLNFSVKADYNLGWADLTAILAYDDLEESLLSDGTSAAFNVYDGTFGPGVPSCLNDVANYQTEYLEYFPEPFSSLTNAFGIPIWPAYSPSTCDGYQYQERNQDSTTFELRLSGEEDYLRWLGGMYYADINREVVVGYGADLGQGFSKKPYVPADGKNPTDSLFWDDFDTEVISAFGQIEYDITPNQEIALAMRWDHEEREVSNKVPNVLAPWANGGGAPINPAYDGSLTDDIPDRKNTFVQFQPKVSWNWQVMDEVNTYASYGVGFRSGGFNNTGSAALIENNYGSFVSDDGVATAPQNLRDDYDKEVSKTFELGFKSEWMDRRLRVNAAIFNTDIEDNQFFNFFAGGFGLQRIVTNIDEVNIKGLEVDFAYLLSENWEFYGSYGMIDSEIEKNSNRPYTEGNEAPLAPEDTANLGLQYTRDIASGTQFLARLDWQYTGETWFSTVQQDTTVNAFDGFFGESNFSKTSRDPYDVLNVRIGIEAEHWNVTFWGKNVLDEEYLAEVIPAPEFGGSFIHQARGEAYGIDVGLRF